MTTRQKLELQINSPVTVELLFDDAITGTSTYGPYYMYAVSVEGKEFSFFAPEEVYSQLKPLKKGDKATITKLAAQRGNKLVTAYDVQVVNKPVSVIADKREDHIEEDSSITPPTDNLRELMLNCLKDALYIQRELGGFGDPERLGITLYISRSKSNNNY